MVFDLLINLLMSRHLIMTWLANKILGLVNLRIELTWSNQRRLPDELRPPLMPPEEEFYPYPLTKETLVIERSRHSILEHGALDSLTVTLSERVNRLGMFDFKSISGYAIDKEKLFAVMDHTQTWTNVKQIKLICPSQSIPRLRGVNAKYHMQLVRRGAHGEEIVTISDSNRHKFIGSDSKLSFDNNLKNEFARRLTEGLKLRHAVVGGVDEYSV